MACAICHIRKPRRYCPGVHGDICTICCGEQREVTVDCPLDCVYLQEAHKHERLPPVNPDDVPNKDIRISEDFLHAHEALLEAASQAVLHAAFEIPGVVDSDVRSLLDALIRTYQTLEKGVYYETRPENSIGNQMFPLVQDTLGKFREREREELGMSKTRDSDVLGVLAFLQKVELNQNNGRPRGRAFLDFLRGYLGKAGEPVPAPRSSSLIVH
ncbi:MAG: hypothetical protein U0Q18_18385 [Bryobacteraceae bacterium]